MASHPEVVILGAGLAGTTAAYHLRDRDVVVIESRDRVGGRTLSGEHDSYWYNSGAQFVWDARTVATGSLKDLLDLGELIVNGHVRGLRDFVPGAADRDRRLRSWRERASGWANAPDGSFEQWVNWYFSDPTTRPDQPGLWRSAPTP